MNQKQLTLIGALEHHGRGTGALQQLRTQGRRQLLPTQFGEGQDRDLGGFDMAFQKAAVIARNARHGDQRLADQHIKKCKKQQAPGQAVCDKPPGTGHARAGSGQHAAHKARKAFKNKAGTTACLGPAGLVARLAGG